jgi:RNA polymerase sigma-70 factor (ECF subfamily)
MTETIENSTILSRIAGGDASAIDDCVRRYGKLVWALARKFTRHHEDAEDAVQEILTEIWLNASRYDSAKSAESTFISTIARRRLIDRLRKVYRRPVSVSIDEVLEVQPNNFEDRINTRIEAGRAVHAMRSLRREQRELIYLNVYEGLSHGEIGERAGMPLGTVKTHIRRGFNRVRQTMAAAAHA